MKSLSHGQGLAFRKNLCFCSLNGSVSRVLRNSNQSIYLRSCFKGLCTGARYLFCKAGSFQEMQFQYIHTLPKCSVRVRALLSGPKWSGGHRGHRQRPFRDRLERGVRSEGETNGKQKPVTPLRSTTHNTNSSWSSRSSSSSGSTGSRGGF